MLSRETVPSAILRQHLVLLCLVIATTCSYAQSTQSQDDKSGDVLPSTEINTTETDQPVSETHPQDGLPDAPGEGDGDTQTQEPAFDIDMLIERMKQTDAIGVISKLSLKNKVDDLLAQAEKIKADESDSDKSQQKMALRENFEGLILKTVALLNKGEDFSLAEDIYLAREELWNSIMENKA